MKRCDKHHGDIEYDEMIYLECPLCRTADYDEVVKENKDFDSHIDDLKTSIDDSRKILDKSIEKLKEAQDKLEW